MGLSCKQKCTFSFCIILSDAVKVFDIELGNSEISDCHFFCMIAKLGVWLSVFDVLCSFDYKENRKYHLDVTQCVWSSESDQL